jgi:hypothetical protein
MIEAYAQIIADKMVPGTGIEPARHCWRQLLKLMRLPISPPRQIFSIQVPSGTNLKFKPNFIADNNADLSQ